MNELLNKINETFDNCMANSNDDTKLQLRILKNNINALFAEYESKVEVPSISYDNQESVVVPRIEENNFEPIDIQYETGMEFEDVTVEDTPASILEPVQQVQPTMQETFAKYESKVEAPSISYDNQESVVVPRIEENNFKPIDNIQYETGMEFEDVTAEDTSASILEPVQVSIVEEPLNVNISQATIPTPQPVQQVQPTMQEAFAVKNDKHNILIVDDSSIVRNYLERVFSEDYNVFLAVDGKDAINQISNDDFIKGISLIILDLMMPNIDGFGVLEYITGRQLSVPIMIISGDNSKETINRAFQYNVVDVIEKPFDAQKIKDKMDRFINL